MPQPKYLLMMLAFVVFILAAAFDNARVGWIGLALLSLAMML